MLNAARRNSTIITIIGIIIKTLIMMQNLQHLQQGEITLERVSDWNDGITLSMIPLSFAQRKYSSHNILSFDLCADEEHNEDF